MKVLEFIAIQGTWETETDRIVFQRIVASSPRVLASEGMDCGWGHHRATAVVEAGGHYYVVRSSGCSCDGNAYVAGPFPSEDIAYEMAPAEISRGDVLDVVDG